MSKFLGKRAKQEPYVYGEQPKDKKYIKINSKKYFLKEIIQKIQLSN